MSSRRRRNVPDYLAAKAEEVVTDIRSELRDDDEGAELDAIATVAGLTESDKVALVIVLARRVVALEAGGWDVMR